MLLKNVIELNTSILHSLQSENIKMLGYLTNYQAYTVFNINLSKHVSLMRDE